MRKIYLLIQLLLILTYNCSAKADNDDLLDKAKAKYQNAEFKKTVKDTTSFLDMHSGDGEALRLRGKAYLCLGQIENAFSDFTSTKQLDGPLEQAMANQNKLDANDDENRDYPDWLQALVFMYVARLSAEQGQNDRPIKFCDGALARFSVFPECLSLRANILFKQNRLYEAEEQYRHALSLRPRDWHTWLGYAYVLEKQVRYQQALQAIEKALFLIKTPIFQEPNLDKRVELMLKTRDYLRGKVAANS
jgi:tetratricopeptide (TPR) repeat protein